MKRVLAAAFAVTILFHIEYTNLWRRVHIPWDLEGYHYPLANTIFLSLKEHRLPLWDSWNYAGIPLAGNIQAALFYPPSWLLYASHLPFGRRLPYASIEAFLIAHIAIAFILFYLWMRRGRGLSETASFAGAAIFAFNGYACSQMTHLGLICNYVWFPLGFWGIDDIAVHGQTRRGIVKLTAASALGLLAGYPATWACFAVCIACYGLASVRSMRATLALAVTMVWSLALCAVQLLPTMEAAPLKQFDPKYAWHSGMTDISYFYALLVPNLYDFDLNIDINTNPGKEYAYFGALGIVGFLLFLVALPRIWRSALPLFAAMAGTLIVMLNPGGWFGRAVEKSQLLRQVFSDWYFLAGLFTILSAFAAIGIDRFLRNDRQRSSQRAGIVLALAAFAWSAYLLSLWIWRHPFATGWASARDAIVGSILVLGLLVCLKFFTPSRVAVAALFVLAFVDYKVFGTSRRINSRDGASNTSQSPRDFLGFSPPAWKRIVQGQPVRTTGDEWGPHPTHLRHGKVATVNGFDPFLPIAYQKLIEARGGKFVTNRTFNLPRDPEALRLLGVGYFITAEASPLYKEFLADPNFKFDESGSDYFKVFALKDPQPPYAFPGGSVHLDRWTSERRRFELESSGQTGFRLSENFYPGWRATLDGQPVAITQCEIAFQCVAVPAGKHSLEFVYWPESLNLGLGTTLMALIALVALGCRSSKKK